MNDAIPSLKSSTEQGKIVKNVVYVIVEVFIQTYSHHPWDAWTANGAFFAILPAKTEASS